MTSLDEIRQKYPQYNSVPDKELADGLYNKFYSGKISQDEYYGRVGFIPDEKVSVMENPELDKDFLQRVGEDWKRRYSNVQEKKTEFKKGKTSPFIVGSKAVGQSAGFIQDIVGEGMVSAFRSLPDFIEEPIRETGAEILNSAVGRTGIKAAQAGGDVWKGFKAKNPDAASLVEDAGNMVGLYYMFSPKQAAQTTAKVGEKTGDVLIKSAKVAGKPVKPAIIGTKQVLKGMAARTPEQIDDAARVLKQQASDLFNQSREFGSALNRNRAINISNRLDSAVKSAGRTNAKIHGDTLSVLKDFKNFTKQGDVHIEDLHQFRQLLNQVIDKNTDAIKGLNPDAYRALRAKQALDESIRSIKPIDVVGGNAEAANLLMKAIDQSARFNKFDDISYIIKKAEGDPNKIQAAFKRFINRPKNLKGFTDQEVAIMKSIANPGKADAILKGLGRFGVDPQNIFLPIIGGHIVAGPAGSALLSSGTIARQLRKVSSRAKPEELLKTIESRIGQAN